MEKPMEIFLNNPDIDIPFCFSWANHTWTKAPGKRDEKVLIRQTYGGEDDWKNHFEYLNRFFQDDRYIKIDNKPIMVIYDAISIDCWHEMKNCWNELAFSFGWSGIYFISTLKAECDIQASVDGEYDAQFEYQPTFGVRKLKKLNYGFWYHLKYNVFSLKLHNHVTKFNYKHVWNSVIKNVPHSSVKTFYGAFNDWDTTARWRKKGNVMPNASPKLFQSYLIKQIEKSKKMNNEFLFVTAWNEWSEGAYLEPDEEIKFGWLEAISNALKSTGEWD